FDVNWPGAAEDIPAIEADPILSRELVTIPVAGTGYFNFNLSKEPFQDKKVRQALADSTYGGPEGLPEITWYGWKDESGEPDAQAQWLYQQFRQVLGV